jgi:hypothetical protein
MSADPYGTAPLFDQVPELPVARPYNDVSTGYGKVRYIRYRVTKPVKCDDCLGAFVGNPNAPASRPAAYKRTQAGANTLLLCHAHKQLRVEQEGLTT